MSQYDTGDPCPVCGKANIVGVVESVSTESDGNMPIGPLSEDYSRRKVTGFHCPNCRVMFHKPEAVAGIFERAKKEEAEKEDKEWKDQFAKRMSEFDKDPAGKKLLERMKEDKSLKGSQG